MALMWPGWLAEANAFPNELTYREHPLTLRGTGILRYGRLLPVYDAALYLPSTAKDEDVLQATPLKLMVEYRVGAAAERFHQAGRDILARNYDADTLAEVEDALRAIESLWPDPQRGDVSAIAHSPGNGVEIFYNGESLGTVGDDHFARIYLSIWFGDYPASVPLKRSLLNRS